MRFWRPWSGSPACRSRPLGPRITISGITTGVVCIVVPEVMGIGYDTVEHALQGNVALGALVAVLCGKVLVSAVTYALRVPVGIIGPTLVIGACTGAVLGTAVRLLAPEFASDTAIYVMLAMGAMMGAVLQAPLAALIAVVELTGTPNITLPAMLAIVVAVVTTNSLFRQRSVFLATLEARGLIYPADPVAQHLQRTGVVGVMDRSFVVSLRAGHPGLRATRPWIESRAGSSSRVHKDRCTLSPHRICNATSTTTNRNEEGNRSDSTKSPAPRWTSRRSIPGPPCMKPGRC